MIIVKEKEIGFILQKNGIIKKKVLLTSDYCEEELESLEKSNCNIELKDGTY